MLKCLYIIVRHNKNYYAFALQVKYIITILIGVAIKTTEKIYLSSSIGFSLNIAKEPIPHTMVFAVSSNFHQKNAL